MGFGETGEVSIVDITGSLTETARGRELRAQMGSWPAWTKRLEIGIARERTTEPQVEHQSERRTTDTCKRRTKRRILQHMVNWRKCSEGNSGSFKHEAKAKVRARVPLILDVDHQQETVNMVQALVKKNAEGNPVHLITRSSRRGTST